MTVVKPLITEKKNHNTHIIVLPGKQYFSFIFPLLSYLFYKYTYNHLHKTP